MDIIGLIGAGVMGLTATRKILEAGRSLLVFDTSLNAQANARSIGADVAPNLIEVARKSDLILMFLPGPEEVESCVGGPDGLLTESRTGMIIVDMSTIDPATTRRMASLARKKQVGYLDAPILGRPISVGRWALPVGGKKKDLDRCVPIFKLFASKIIHVGNSGAGNKIKLLNQLMFSAINAMTAEMMAISEKTGIPRKLLYETIISSQAGTVSNLFLELGKSIVASDYDHPTFSVDLLCKDVRLAIAMAQESGAPPILARTIQFINEMAQSQGFGNRDTSVMWKAFKPVWNGEG